MVMVLAWLTWTAVEPEKVLSVPAKVNEPKFKFPPKLPAPDTLPFTVSPYPPAGFTMLVPLVSVMSLQVRLASKVTVKPVMTTLSVAPGNTPELTAEPPAERDQVVFVPQLPEAIA